MKMRSKPPDSATHPHCVWDTFFVGTSVFERVSPCTLSDPTLGP